MKRIMRRKTEMNADLNCMSHLQMCKKKIILIVCEKTCSWNFESDDARKTSKDDGLNKSTFEYIESYVCFSNP